MNNIMSGHPDVSFDLIEVGSSDWASIDAQSDELKHRGGSSPQSPPTYDNNNDNIKVPSQRSE